MRRRVPLVGLAVLLLCLSRTSGADGASGQTGAPGEGSSSLPAVLLECEVSSRSPYVGEEFLYTLRLLSSTPLQRALCEKPSFVGCGAWELGSRTLPSVSRGDRQYQVQEIRYRLVAERSGAISIGPARVTCEVPGRSLAPPDAPAGGDDPFFGRSFSSAWTLSTEALRLLARPLPPYRGREPFSGLIGEYALTAKLDRGRTPRGEPALLTLELRGSGDLTGAPEPSYPEPSGLRLFPENGAPSGGGEARTFRKVVVPTAAGMAELGPFRLVVFDPKAGRYRTVEAGPVRLETTGPAAADANSPPPRALPLKSRPAALASAGEGGEAAFVCLLLLAPALAWFIASWARFRRETSTHRSTRRLVSTHLRQAGKALAVGAAPEALSHLHWALLLVSPGPSVEPPAKARLLDVVEEARFSLEAAPKRGLEEVFAYLERVDRLARASWRGCHRWPPRLIWAAAAILVLGAGGVWSVLGDEAPVSPSALADFAQGADAYRRGAFGPAAERFVRVAQRGVRSGDLYSDIGNAYLLSGDYARALLWYERAALLVPGDGGVRAQRQLAVSRIGSEAGPLDGWGALRSRLGERRFALRGLAAGTNLLFWGLVCARRCGRREAAPRVDGRREPLAVEEGGAPRGPEARPALRNGSLVSAGVVAASVVLFALVEYGAARSCREAFVVAAEAVGRSGLTDQTTELFRLRSGTRVRLDAWREQRIRIRTGDARVGWISATVVMPVDDRLEARRMTPSSGGEGAPAAPSRLSYRLR
ncbi:MAG: BatD family protein [Deltaproteobacteria bacterium]|nr:BatD family protein [Deltaproteobacteria bacterium]